jgi:3-ketoacyl-CoA synthase
MPRNPQKLLPFAPPLPSQLELANMWNNGDLQSMWSVARETHLTFNMVTFVLSCLLLVFVAATYVFTRSRPVYLLNYHCFKPPAK